MTMRSDFASHLKLRCVEPQKRMCGGTGPRWVVHRFPIKSGLSFYSVCQEELAQAVSRPSAFLRLFKADAIQQMKSGDSK